MLDAVLFVDDDEDLRDVMRDMLETLGVLHVLTLGSLRDLEARRDEALACQLAILDINLGSYQPSGVEVHDWLQREGFAGRIVFLTGHAGNDPLVRAAASLVHAQVASKPLSVTELRHLLGGARRAI